MIKADSGLMQRVSRTIRTSNNTMNTDFQGLSHFASTMDNAWNGTASQNAMSAYYKLKNYAQPRYNVLENLAKAIDSMESGYEKTETTNKSLASQFK